MIRFKGGNVMSNLMRIFGAVLIAAAIGIVLLLKFSTAQMQILGITPETVAILLVGGVLSLGLAGVISGLSNMASSEATVIKLPTAATSVSEAVDEPAAELPKMDFGKKRFDANTTSSALPPVSPSPAKAQPNNSVADTIAALEQAKSDIKTALGGVESMGAPAETPVPAYVSPPPVLAPQEPETDEPADGELFVVEEKIIRGRPSRILSDETVEAETDEGWMRFENLDHLNEYLDSLEEGEA